MIATVDAVLAEPAIEAGLLALSQVRLLHGTARSHRQMTGVEGGS
ncbi:hypothetical protein [Methylobacterium sp. J-001]|nr:hypothetical protein [Methylobacterium sp. J-001]